MLFLPTLIDVILIPKVHISSPFFFFFFLKLQFLLFQLFSTSESVIFFFSTRDMTSVNT